MIMSFILYIIYGLVWVLTAPFRLFADVSIETGIGGAISTATTYVASLNDIIPLSTAMICVGIIFGIELIVIAYKIVMWVIRRIPTQS